MTVLVERLGDLTLESAERVAFRGEGLALAGELVAAVDAMRVRALAVLQGGTRVYGVTTGMGYLAGTDLTPEQQRSHQRNLLIGRAVGSPPWLQAGEARAVLVARLASFLSGHAGVSSALCAFLVDRLNDGFVPAIPATSVGGAGEVLPLAHAFQTFVGVGTVLRGDGTPCDAADALRARGVDPYVPGPKEGIALLAGAPCATALALARHRAARVLARQLRAGAAAAISALGAPLDPYDAAVEQLDDDPLLAAVLRDLRGQLGQAPSAHGSHQAPVSFRVVPQVLAHVEREIGRLQEDVGHALRTTTDSPAFVGDRFVSNGGFHAVQLAADLDTVGAALIRAAELAGQRVHRLLDRRFTGLPDQLTPDPGPQAGLVVVHKRVAGAVHELRGLAAPASTGQADTALGQEDAGTFVFLAAAKLRRIESVVREVLACELLTARQAWALRGVAPPGFAVALAAAVAPVDVDRPLGPDLTALVDLLERDELFSPGPGR